MLLVMGVSVVVMGVLRWRASTFERRLAEEEGSLPTHAPVKLAHGDLALENARLEQVVVRVADVVAAST
jgi:hypothetical protein